MTGGASINTGGSGPVPEMNIKGSELAGRERYELEAPAILRELHSQGVTFQCIEGIGDKFFIRPVSFQGKLVSKSLGAREVEVEQGVESIQLTTFTLEDAKGKMETFESFGNLDIPKDCQISVKGARLVFDTAMIDFFGGATKEVWDQRLQDLKELLAQSNPVLPFEISSGKKKIYENQEFKAMVEDMCSGRALSGRDWWGELLKEVEDK
jgi:hypothetical protein